MPKRSEAFPKPSEPSGALICITTLATHRIGAIDLMPDSFTVDRAQNLDRHRQEAFGVVWEEPIKVVLRFRADQVPYVA